MKALIGLALVAVLFISHQALAETYFEIPNGSTAIVGVRTTSVALVNFNTKITATVNGKNFLVLVAVTSPPFNGATQIRTGPVDIYDGTTATRVFTVRAKTQGELDAEEEARALSATTIKGLQAVLLYAAERAGDDITQATVRQTAFNRAKAIYKLLP